MGKDKYARRRADVAMIAWGNLVAAMVKTMRDEGVATDTIRAFLDNLVEVNNLTLDRDSADFAAAVVALNRSMLPSND